jgi:hypothetical protein
VGYTAKAGFKDPGNHERLPQSGKGILSGMVVKKFNLRR